MIFDIKKLMAEEAILIHAEERRRREQRETLPDTAEPAWAVPYDYEILIDTTEAAGW